MGSTQPSALQAETKAVGFVYPKIKQSSSSSL